MMNWFWQAKFWTYSMTYGPGLPMQQSSWKLTSGFAYVGRFLRSSSTWMTNQSRQLSMTIWLVGQLTRQVIRLSSSRWFPRHQYMARHRGVGRSTRALNRALRMAQLEAAQARKVFQELANDHTLVGVAYYAPGSRAYRKLSWSNLNHEAIKLRARFFPGDEYDQVP